MKNKKIIIMGYFVFLLVSICIFGFILSYEVKLNQVAEDSQYSFNSGWLVVRGNEVTKNTNLRTLAFSSLKKGETIILQNKYPTLSYSNPTLWFSTIYSTIDVQIDNQLVYSYGHDIAKRNVNVGSGFHLIDLSEAKPESLITVTLQTTENNAFSSISDVHIEEATSVYPNFIGRHQFTLASAVFLITTGVLATLLLGCILYKGKKIYPLIALAQFALWTGLGVLCNHNYIQLFSSNFTINSYLEYLALYALPLSLFFIFDSLIAQTALEKKIERTLITVYSSYCFIALCFQITGIAHLPASLPVWQILMGLSIGFAVFITIKQLIQAPIRQSVLSIGFLVLMGFCGIDIIRYAFQKYVFENMPLLFNSLLSFGAIIFIFSGVLSYFTVIPAVQSKENVTDSIPNYEATEKLDYITGVYNRDALYQKIRFFAEEAMINPEQEYSILTFDLLNFEETENQFGQFAAESMLHDFAILLKRVFDCYGSIGRIGKSRFVVVSTEMMEPKLKQLIFTFTQLVEKSNGAKFMQTYRTTYGYAFSYETDIFDKMSVCRLAENRMGTQKIESLTNNIKHLPNASV